MSVYFKWENGDQYEVGTNDQTSPELSGMLSTNFSSEVNSNPSAYVTVSVTSEPLFCLTMTDWPVQLTWSDSSMQINMLFEKIHSSISHCGSVI